MFEWKHPNYYKELKKLREEAEKELEEKEKESEQDKEEDQSFLSYKVCNLLPSK